MNNCNNRGKGRERLYRIDLKFLYLSGGWMLFDE